MKSVCVVGGGQAGRAIGRLLRDRGYRIERVVCRTVENARKAAEFLGAGEPSTRAARADLIVIAVPDGEIANAAAALGDARDSLVFHLSGAVSSEVLRGIPGARVGSLHPLRSFADPGAAAASFAGTFCAVEGPAADELAALASEIGGVPVRIRPEGKALYHAGAVFASNYLVAVLEGALRLFEAAGIRREEALPAIAGLARGTLENVGRIGIPRALTGPVERGDAETVRRHVAALQAERPDLAGLYASLGRLAVEVALAKGSIGREAAGRLNAAFGTVEGAGVVVP